MIDYMFNDMYNFMFKSIKDNIKHSVKIDRAIDNAKFKTYAAYKDGSQDFIYKYYDSGIDYNVIKLISKDITETIIEGMADFLHFCFEYFNRHYTSKDEEWTLNYICSTINTHANYAIQNLKDEVKGNEESNNKIKGVDIIEGVNIKEDSRKARERASISNSTSAID